MNIRLDNKNAVVCGSSKGIGFAIARQYAEMGANVTMLSRSEENLKKAISELSQNGKQNHTYIANDFIKPQPVIDVFNENIKNGTDYHILVNNSGGPAPGLVSEAEPKEFLEAFQRHVIMSQLLAKTLLPGMKKNEYGRIINVISISVKQPVENLGVSNTIRGAMNSWSKTLSREVAQYGITVNNILPGHTKTERLESLFINNAKKQGISPEEFADKVRSQIPAKRFAKPEELAYLAGFLASDRASFVNGVSIPVDGGYVKGF